MNIIKLQDELKGVPDNALIGYVQNPTGQVPTYLALSELQRRKTMREKFQQQQAPQTTVAEDLGQKTMPDQGGLAMLAGQPQMQMEDQGVAGLPVPDDMYQDQNFAGGGIVAFGPGGEVATSKFGDFFRGLGNPAALEINKQIGALEAEKNRLKSSIFTPKTPTEKVADVQRIKEIDAQISALSTKKSSTPAASATQTIPTSAVPGGPRIDATQLPKSFTGIGETTQFGPSTTAINQMSPPPTAATAKPSGPDLGGLYQPLTDYSKDYAALYQDPAGMAEKEMARYRGLIGEDKMRPQLEEKLKKMEERSAKAEEQAPYMALIRAGFGMAAGKSPFALQNLAEGATMGLEDYNKARDKLEASRDKQFDLQARLAQAKRAEDVAAATFGSQSEQFIKAQNQANKLAELSYKTNREAANQKNKIDAFDAVQKGKYYDASAEESRAKAGYYSEKGPGGEITEKQLFDKYMTTGGDLIHGSFEEFKQKNLPKAMPLDINNIVNKYTLPK